MVVNVIIVVEYDYHGHNPTLLIIHLHDYVISHLIYAMLILYCIKYRIPHLA